METIKAALKQPNKWHFINEIINGKNISLKMFVGTKQVDIQIFKINGLHASINNYQGKKATLDSLTKLIF